MKFLVTLIFCLVNVCAVSAKEPRLLNFGEPYYLHFTESWSWDIKELAEEPGSPFPPTYELTSVSPRIRLYLMIFEAKSELDAYETMKGERLQAVYSPKLSIQKLQWEGDVSGFLWIARNSGIAYFPVENQWFRAFFTQDDDDKVSGLEQVFVVLKSLKRGRQGEKAAFPRRPPAAIPSNPRPGHTPESLPGVACVLSCPVWLPVLLLKSGTIPPPRPRLRRLSFR